MISRTLVAAVAVLSLSTLSACGSGDDSSSGAPDAPSSPTSSAPAKPTRIDYPTGKLCANLSTDDLASALGSPVKVNYDALKGQKIPQLGGKAVSTMCDLNLGNKNAEFAILADRHSKRATVSTQLGIVRQNARMNKGTCATPTHTRTAAGVVTYLSCTGKQAIATEVIDQGSWLLTCAYYAFQPIKAQLPRASMDRGCSLALASLA